MSVKLGPCTVTFRTSSGNNKSVIFTIPLTSGWFKWYEVIEDSDDDSDPPKTKTITQ
jgi:hypothetical protein